jgi:TolB-like protein/tetratricopeptide (TPR) repeat protein/predicted Ser/Thr protein kinase
MIGRTLGRYRILAKLGEGGMGTVWKAEDALLGRTVALKLLSDRLWDSEHARERFLREARAASKLEHPGIATVFDTGQEEGLSYIAFQFIDGETLAKKLLAGPLALGEAVRLARGVAEALAHAHERGVLHRDVTSGNVMVTADGRAVIVDFGLALPERGTHLTTTGTTVGTAPYLAPEVVMGKPADERSDLYGMGVVLYQMVAGKLPFEAGHTEALLFKAVHETAPRPSATRAEVPRALDAIILRLLEKEPEDRYSTAGELVGDLRRLEGSGVLGREARARAGTPGWPARMAEAAASVPRAVRRAARRVGRLRLGVATVIAIAIVAAAGQWAWQRGWRPGGQAAVRTLAVLPMRDTGPDPEETSYLAEGFGEELVTRLGQLSGIRVLPWITTQRYGDPKRPLLETASELRADRLLVGSYQSDGERIRVSLELVDGKSGRHRWVKAYEEPISDLFALQSSITMGVGTQLKGKVTDEERRQLAIAPSRSPEAYDYFIRGSDYTHAGDPQSQALALQFFEKAIELDSTLAEAYVGLGAIHTDRSFRGLAVGNQDLDQAERYFRRALQINPTLAAAERGLIRVYWENGQTEEVLKIAHNAAQRGPDDVESLLVQGWGYTLGTLPEKAVTPLERAIELDPANQAAAWYHVIALEWSERLDEAVEAGKAYIRKFGEDPEIYTWMANASACRGRWEEARLYFERAIDLFGDEQSNLYVVVDAVYFYLGSGQREKALALSRLWIERLEQRLRANPDNDGNRMVLSNLYAAIGQKEAAERLAGEFLSSAPDSSIGRVGEGLFAVALSLALAGNTKLALQMYRELRATTDLSFGWGLTTGCIRSRRTSGLPRNLLENAEFQSLLRDIDARMKALRSRY